MTTDDEYKTRIKQTEQFLLALIGARPSVGYPLNFKRVPRAIRVEAYRLLRHYPTRAVVDMYWNQRV